ncbi:MAG TPA: di-heme oxidoredictase family protein [Vicinamibacterales bacterium]|nr:di-heme oxidoredictase family protein [Vicinamibacterales bacterium]
MFKEAGTMIRKSSAIFFLLLGVMALRLAGIAQQSATEAPAGFDTPTLAVNPGSRSTSNGIEEPPGDSFALDQQIYEQIHDVDSGLGPVFNGRACAECHQNPVSGGASQFTELRVGHRDPDGIFVNPTVLINHGADSISGRSIINDRALIPEAQEHVPVTEDIRALRAALNTLGDGFVEAIDDTTLLAIAERQEDVSEGRIHGEAIQVPVLEAPGQTRVGRFGWKDQHSSLLSFIGDAYLNEMGVTNRLRPKDTTTVGKVTSDPEDTPDDLGLADIDHFAQFIRGTKVPPRDTVLAASVAGRAGQNIFEKIGCNTCHVASITTAPAGTAINGGTFLVPDALGNKIIHPYSDFLLHDIETGDGIVQTPPQDTADKLRTAPLWGLRMRPRYMHVLRSLTLEDAIARHLGEARHISRRFRGLSPAEKQQLFTFLNSL